MKHRQRSDYYVYIPPPPLLFLLLPLLLQSRLLEHKNLGVVTSVMSLLMGLASKCPGNYEGLVPLIIHLLTRLVRERKENTGTRRVRHAIYRASVEISSYAVEGERGVLKWLSWCGAWGR